MSSSAIREGMAIFTADGVPLGCVVFAYESIFVIAECASLPETMLLLSDVAIIGIDEAYLRQGLDLLRAVLDERAGVAERRS